MLNHQKRFAHEKSGFAARAISQTFGAWTSRLLCCQKRISAVSWWYQPLATTPWTLGITPVR